MDSYSILSIIVGWIIGYWVVSQWLEVQQEREREIEVIMAEDELTVIRTKLEVHQDCYYLFREDTDAFVAQGRDAQELERHVNQRFPRCHFIIAQGDQEALQRIKAQLEGLDQVLLSEQQ